MRVRFGRFSEYKGMVVWLALWLLAMAFMVLCFVFTGSNDALHSVVGAFALLPPLLLFGTSARIAKKASPSDLSKGVRVQLQGWIFLVLFSGTIALWVVAATVVPHADLRAAMTTWGLLVLPLGSAVVLSGTAEWSVRLFAQPGRASSGVDRSNVFFLVTLPLVYFSTACLAWLCLCDATVSISAQACPLPGDSAEVQYVATRGWPRLIDCRLAKVRVVDDGVTVVEGSSPNGHSIRLPPFSLSGTGAELQASVECSSFNRAEFRPVPLHPRNSDAVCPGPLGPEQARAWDWIIFAVLVFSASVAVLLALACYELYSKSPPSSELLVPPQLGQAESGVSLACT